jgi:hypothetical protein
MAKNKKKRNKVYTGVDAALTKPVITHISAVNRSKPAQWWFEHSKTVKRVLITVGLVLILVLVIIEIVRIATGR